MHKNSSPPIYIYLRRFLPSVYLLILFLFSSSLSRSFFFFKPRLEPKKPSNSLTRLWTSSWWKIPLPPPDLRHWRLERLVFIMPSSLRFWMNDKVILLLLLNLFFVGFVRSFNHHQKSLMIIDEKETKIEDPVLLVGHYGVESGNMICFNRYF